MIVRSLKNLIFTLDENKRLKNLDIHGIFLELSKRQLEVPRIIETAKGKVVVEDLKTNPMNLALRWGIVEDFADYRLSDHQERFIITFEETGTIESYVFPKVFEESEPIARVTVNESHSPIPFIIELAEVSRGKIQNVTPRKIKKQSKILLGTQILGHVQDAGNIMRWAQRNGTLESKWEFALPATRRTEVTKAALRKEGIAVNSVTKDWSYAGGKDFRTGLEYKENFGKSESFSTVTAFVAANARLCIGVTKGEYGVVSTHFRPEAQLMKKINPNIVTCGITHTFLTGKLKERIHHHDDLPKFAKMLRRVQESIDCVPERVKSLGGNIKYIDYYWKINNQKIQMLDILLYYSFDLDPGIHLRDTTTQVIEIPLAVPKEPISKEKARKSIAAVIGKKLEPADKIIILAGESDDGSFKRRAQEVFAFIKKHSHIHVIMPLKPEDQRLVGLDIPENAHAIGFRKDWWEMIPGGDVAFIRGSWGEMADLIFSGTVPVITSPGTVPMDADLDTTQFLTQVSEERACNLSLLIKALQTHDVKAETINGLLVDLGSPKDGTTLQKAIEFALQSGTANEVRKALSHITRGGTGWVVKLHEKLLDQKRPFSDKELKKLQKRIWTKEKIEEP